MLRITLSDIRTFQAQAASDVGEAEGPDIDNISEVSSLELAPISPLDTQQPVVEAGDVDGTAPHLTATGSSVGNISVLGSVMSAGSSMFDAGGVGMSISEGDLRHTEAASHHMSPSVSSVSVGGTPGVPEDLASTYAAFSREVQRRINLRIGRDSR